jgi:hypothetical protein
MKRYRTEIVLDYTIQKRMPIDVIANTEEEAMEHIYRLGIFPRDSRVGSISKFIETYPYEDINIDSIDDFDLFENIDGNGPDSIYLQEGWIDVEDNIDHLFTPEGKLPNVLPR